MEKESTDKELWDWTQAFKKIAADIAKCIAQYLAAECEKVSMRKGKHALVHACARTRVRTVFVIYPIA